MARSLPTSAVQHAGAVRFTPTDDDRTRVEVSLQCAPPGGTAGHLVAGGLTGADVRTLMDRTLWARFGEVALKAPHALRWLSDNGPRYTATVLYAQELGRV